MSNMSKKQWQSNVIADARENRGIPSVDRLMVVAGCSRQHAKNSILAVLERASKGGIRWDVARNVPTKDTDPATTRVWASYADSTSSARVSEEDLLADMIPADKPPADKPAK